MHDNRYGVNGFMMSADWYVCINLTSSSCLLLIAAVWLLLTYSLRRHNRGKMTSSNDDISTQFRTPPGRFGWPIIGETIDFVTDGRKYFRSRRAQYGPVFSSHLAGSKTAVVTGAPAVRRVLSASEADVTACPAAGIPRLLGKNALSSQSGVAHRNLQRLLVRLFSARNMSRYSLPLQSVMRARVAEWCAADGKAVRAVPCCRQLSMDIAKLVLIGCQRGDVHYDVISTLVTTLSAGVFSMPINLPGFAYCKGLEARRKLIDILSSRFSAAIDSHSDQTEFLFRDILSCDQSERANGHHVTMDTALDVALEFLFSSHETTASAMCSALLCLARHRDVIVNIRQELATNGVRGTQDVPNDVIRSLTYTNDVVKEVLRIQPPVAGGFRQAKTALRVEDYVIPAGWKILYGITDTHEMSHFQDVFEFRPERWRGSAQTCSETDHIRPCKSGYLVDYLPFGGGKRFCVGKEFATFVLTIFLVELVRGSDWTMVNPGLPEIRTMPFPFPKDDLPLVFQAVSSISRSN